MIVKGEEKGIGRSVEENFMEEGEKVIGMDSKDGEEDEKFRMIRIDIKDEEEVREVREGIKEEGKKIDIMVNVEGVMKIGKRERMREEDWKKWMDVNERGKLNIIRKWVKVLREKRKGEIVNVE